MMMNENFENKYRHANISFKKLSLIVIKMCYTPYCTENYVSEIKVFLHISLNWKDSRFLLIIFSWKDTRFLRKKALL